MKISHCSKRGRNCLRLSPTSFKSATGDLPGSQSPEFLLHLKKRHWMKSATPPPPSHTHSHHKATPKQIFSWALTGLQIPVHDPVKVAVLYARDNLLEYRSGLVRIKAALRHDVVEQLAPGNVLLKKKNTKLQNNVYFVLLVSHEIEAFLATVARIRVPQAARGSYFGIHEK